MLGRLLIWLRIPTLTFFSLSIELSPRIFSPSAPSTSINRRKDPTSIYKAKLLAAVHPFYILCVMSAFFDMQLSYLSTIKWCNPLTDGDGWWSTTSWRGEGLFTPRFLKWDVPHICWSWKTKEYFKNQITKRLLVYKKFFFLLLSIIGIEYFMGLKRLLVLIYDSTFFTIFS